MIERIQNVFIKKIMGLPPRTAGYILRLELNRQHVQVKVFKRLLRFWVKVVNLADSRLPKMLLLDALRAYKKNSLGPWLNVFERNLNSIGLSLA